MKLLRLQEVIQMTGLSRSTIYRYGSAAVFPKRRRAGPNSVRWLDADVVKWMETRPESRLKVMSFITRKRGWTDPATPGVTDRFRRQRA
jgi:prophage regulatory protein